MRTRIPVAILAAGLSCLAAPAAQAVPVPELVGHSANWLEARGIAVGQPAVVTDDPLAHRVFTEDGRLAAAGEVGVIAVSGPEGVSFGVQATSDVALLADRYGRRGKLTEQQVESARIVLHELLHQLRPDSFWDEASHADILTEEGVVEAVTHDLLGDYARQMFGHRIWQYDGTAYPVQVQRVRTLSVLAVGRGNWTSRAAEGWRARLLRAERTERVQLVEQALLARKLRTR